VATPADEDEAVAVALADARLYAAKAAGRNRVMD
jgi:GGDEF domain-containing protein